LELRVRKIKRINQAIELLERGQPVYYTGSHSGTAGTYEQGVKDAQTYADYISYDMEHTPYDIKVCRNICGDWRPAAPTEVVTVPRR